MATYSAAKKLANISTQGILIDNSVIGHAVTHETAWIGTGQTVLGQELGYAARIPVYSDSDDSDVARSVRHLPGIASLARRGHLKLFASDELSDERWTQPAGRFSGYGYYDLFLFHGVRIESIRDPDYRVEIGPSYMNLPDIKEQRRARLSAKDDRLYLSLAKALGKKNSQDAWHITVAEREGLYCFLTMDFKLIRNIRAQSRNPAVARLKTRILSPEEFGKEFRIPPIPTRLFSYHDASFPVVHGKNWSDSRRAKRPRSK